MANEIEMTCVATVGSDPEVRQAGEKRVLSIRLAHSARVKRGQEWVDTETQWFDGSLWERWAGDARIDNVMASLAKGMRVEVRGDAYQEAWESREGKSGISNRLTIRSIAPSLERASAAVTKNEKREGGGGGQAAPAGGGWGQSATQTQAGWGQTAAPAAAPAEARAAANWGTSFDAEAPF